MRDDYDEAGRFLGGRSNRRMSEEQDGAGRYTQQDAYEDFDLSEQDLEDYEGGEEDGYEPEEYSFAKDLSRRGGGSPRSAGIFSGRSAGEFAGASSGYGTGYGGGGGSYGAGGYSDGLGMDGYENTSSGRSARGYDQADTGRGFDGYRRMSSGRGSDSSGSTGAGRGSSSYSGAGAGRGSDSYGSTRTGRGTDGYGSKGSGRGLDSYGGTGSGRGADGYGGTGSGRGMDGYGSTGTGRGTDGGYGSTGTGRGADGGYGSKGSGRVSDSYGSAGTGRGYGSAGSDRSSDGYGGTGAGSGRGGSSRRAGQTAAGDYMGKGGAGASQRATSRAAAQTAKAKKKKRLLIFALAELIALVCIFSVGYVARRMALVQRPTINTKDLVNPELTVAKQEHMKGYWTIAVFGVDSRGNNVTKGTNADVNMICSINMDTGEIRLVSVYRDTYLNISDGNTYNKLNAAYANGGPDQAIKALNKNLDLNIKDYVTFNWKAVADGINILGGVDVDISKAEFYYINAFITETVKATGLGANQLKKAGTNHLNGVQAVAYGRLRLMDTDYARTERQRLIISKSFDKAKQADYATLNNILVTCLPQTATNLDFTDLTNMALGFGKYHLGESTGFPFAKGSLVMGGKGDCVVPQTLESNVVELHKFLYGKENYEPTDTVKKISVKIAADSGMYKEGKNSGKEDVSGGKVPKTTEAEKSTEESSLESEETSEGVTLPGRPLETDADGNPIETPSESGSDITNPNSPTRPGETRPGETKPGESKPGETKPGETKPGTTKPGETEPGTGTTRPDESSPGTTKPSETNPSGTKPEPTTSPNENSGPGIKPTEPTTEASKPSEPSGEGTTAAPTVAPPPIQPGADTPNTPQTSGAGNGDGPGNS